MAAFGRKRQFKKTPQVAAMGKKEPSRWFNPRLLP